MPKYLTDEQRLLVENHHYLIDRVLNLLSLSLDDIEDWYGVAAIALCNAAMSYDTSKVEFNRNATVCILNSIRDQLRSGNEGAMHAALVEAACERLARDNAVREKKQ